MAKFAIGEFVKVGTGSRATFGRVVGRAGVRYRVFTVAREQWTVSARQMSHHKRVALILESTLSKGRKGLRTDQQRRAGLFLEEFFRSLDVTVLREKVHSPEDFKSFMHLAQHQDVLFVHWSGHGGEGSYEYGRNRVTGLLFTHGEFLYLPVDSEQVLLKSQASGRYRRHMLTAAGKRSVDEELRNYALIRESFSGLREKVLVFSACNIGKDHGLAEYISKVSAAKAVITYDDEITDKEANLAEALLYFKLVCHENKQRPPSTLVAEVRSALTTEAGEVIPMVCFVNGERVS